eukprot:scaffold2177_cov115-Cylindrotheca_fusiformis.AAC.6
MSDTAVAMEQWERWMPMDQKSFRGVQLCMLAMLQKLDELLQDVPYWICGGTLIGAIRHAGFIPHDDDVDIEIRVSDLAAVKEIPLEPPFYSGFVLDAGQWEGNRVSKLFFFNGEFEVDVFHRPDNLPKMRNYPSKEEVFPLTRYPFHNIDVWGPCRDTCSAYLERCYGKDWQSVVCVWNHDFNYYHTKAFDKRKVVVPLDKYNEIVSAAGIQPPMAESSADLTYQKFCRDFGAEFFVEYKRYRSQRTFRWNRADADWRYEQSLNQESSLIN